MIIQVDVDIDNTKADDIIRLLKDNGYTVQDYWSDEVIITSCPNCGEIEYWEVGNRYCNHCGFSA